MNMTTMRRVTSIVECKTDKIDLFPSAKACAIYHAKALIKDGTPSSEAIKLALSTGVRVHNKLKSK